MQKGRHQAESRKVSKPADAALRAQQYWWYITWSVYDVYDTSKFSKWLLINFRLWIKRGMNIYCVRLYSGKYIYILKSGVSYWAWVSFNCYKTTHFVYAFPSTPMKLDIDSWFCDVCTNNNILFITTAARYDAMLNVRYSFRMYDGILSSTIMTTWNCGRSLLLRLIYMNQRNKC